MKKNLFIIAIFINFILNGQSVLPSGGNFGFDCSGNDFCDKIDPIEILSGGQDFEVSSGEKFTIHSRFYDLDACKVNGINKPYFTTGPYRIKVTSSSVLMCSFSENNQLFLPSLDYITLLSGITFTNGKPEQALTGNIYVKLDNSWSGQNPIFITVEIIDESPNPDLIDPSVSTTWTISKRTPECPTTLKVVDDAVVYSNTYHEFNTADGYVFDLKVGELPIPTYHKQILNEDITSTPLFMVSDMRTEVLAAIAQNLGLTTPTVSDIMKIYGWDNAIFGVFIIPENHFLQDIYNLSLDSPVFPFKKHKLNTDIVLVEQNYTCNSISLLKHKLFWQVKFLSTNDIKSKVKIIQQ
jgi:hypothetical protein